MEALPRTQLLQQKDKGKIRRTMRPLWFDEINGAGWTSQNTDVVTVKTQGHTAIHARDEIRVILKSCPSVLRCPSNTEHAP